jgi:hypothetical protein
MKKYVWDNFGNENDLQGLKLLGVKILSSFDDNL